MIGSRKKVPIAARKNIRLIDNIPNEDPAEKL
jgi:hypothetical protein